MSLHPDEEVPLTEDGEPFDFLWDSSHPCTHIPWLKNIPKGDSLTTSVDPPNPTAVASTSHNSLYSRSSTPPRSRSSTPSKSLNFIEDDVNYLKSLNFRIQFKSPFPRIDGLLPGLSEYISQKTSSENRHTLRAYFILIPEYKAHIAKDGCYCSVEEIGIENFQEIRNISSAHVSKINSKLKGKKNMLECCCNGWVSNTRSLFYSYYLY